MFLAPPRETLTCINAASKCSPVNVDGPGGGVAGDGDVDVHFGIVLGQLGQLLTLPFVREDRTDVTCNTQIMTSSRDRSIN
jgi:hypothetical protein